MHGETFPSDRSEETRSLGNVLTNLQTETTMLNACVIDACLMINLADGEAIEDNWQLSNKTLFESDRAEFLVARGQH